MLVNDHRNRGLTMITDQELEQLADLTKRRRKMEGRLASNSRKITDLQNHMTNEQAELARLNSEIAQLKSKAGQGGPPT